MKEKLIEFYRKNKLAVLTAAIVFFVGLIVLTIIIILNSNDLKEYNTDTYTIKYDKSWKIKDKSETTINLKHSSKSKINIEVMTLEEEYKYLESEDIIEELLYNIGLENKDYKLLQKKQSNITKNNYDGYKVLYEDDQSQVMVVIAKKSDKVMLFTYEATNEYFDILLDSVQSIIYNFDIKDEVYKINNTVTIETEELEWETNESLVSNIKKNKTYEIANNNYSVKLSIPKNFQAYSFDSTYGYYSYTGLEKGSISLTVNILNKNIYEYLQKEEKYGTLYYEYKTHRNGTSENYQNFTETMTKLDNEDYEAYLYKSEYTYKGYSSDSKYENYYMIYELNNNHILLFKLVSMDNAIPQELINKIKFSDVTNYSSNIDKQIVDNKLIGTLKRFTDYSKNKYNEITLKIPTTYKELDHHTNIYMYRYYGLNYDSNNDIYQYDVKYTLTSTSITKEKAISNITIYTNTGSYQALTSTGTKNLNGKNFEVYSGGYNDYGVGYNKDSSDKNYYVHKKVLLYSMESGGYLVIEIDGNGSEITDQVLNDLTNIDIMIKEY